MASAEEGLNFSQRKRLKKKKAAERAKQQEAGTGCAKADSALAAASSNAASSNAASSNAAPATAVAAASGYDEELKFTVDQEILYCVKQLELGVAGIHKSHRNPKSLEHVQTAKMRKLIAKLQSPNTPLPEKRMLMRGNFGDYRAKMRAAFKAHAPATAEEEPSIHPADPDYQANGKFYRKSRHLQESDDAAAKPSEPSEPSEPAAPTAAVAKAENEAFRFNFGGS